MANRKINLMIYAKVAGVGWRRYPAAIGGNGKIRPGFGVMQGHLVKFDQFRYELSQYRGDQKVYTPAGTDAAEAFNLLKREQNAVHVREQAKLAGIAVVADEKRKQLRKAADEFIQRAKDRGTMEAALIYEKVLDDFICTASKQGVQFVDEVTEATLLRFQGWLRETGASDRTVFNRHNNVCALLRWAGLDKKHFGPKPTFEKKLPRAYSRDEVSSLLGAANEYTTVMLDVMRMAGLREQEAMYLQWADIDLKRAILHVRSKPDDGFEIKDREQRDIPMPAELATTLRKWKERRKGTTWVLGTRNDRPNTKMLLFLKWCAKRAGLNCGRCDACKEREECELFTLHALRRTYATSLARSGVDIHGIKDLLGHSDIQTTMAYLGAMKSEEKRKAIDRVKW
jgi:integrase